MKKIFIMLCSLACLPTLVLAWRWCCSWHGWQSYCADNGRWVCNDGTYSPSCTCTPPQKTITYTYWTTTNNSFDITKQIKLWTTTTTKTLTNDEKCNKKYPWTIYRSSDNRCACPWDTKWTSSWSKENNCTKTTQKKQVIKEQPKESEDEKCNKKYPWTIYRASDNRCACPWDSKWTSTWSKGNHCNKVVYNNTYNSYYGNNNYGYYNGYNDYNNNYDYYNNYNDYYDDYNYYNNYDYYNDYYNYDNNHDKRAEQLLYLLEYWY